VQRCAFGAWLATVKFARHFFIGRTFHWRGSAKVALVKTWLAKTPTRDCLPYKLQVASFQTNKQL
jgi:hypothetical protein